MTTQTLTLQDRAAAALADARRAAYQATREREEQERVERNRAAERIVQRSLGIQAVALDGRVVLDGVTLVAYTRRDEDSYSRTDYLRLEAPCPHCGALTVGPNMASGWGDAWVNLGEQLERFTPDFPPHLSGECVRGEETDDNAEALPTATPNPTPAEALLAALTTYIDWACQRHANDE